MSNRFAAVVILSFALTTACCNTTKTADNDLMRPEYLPAADVAGWETEAVVAPAPEAGVVPAAAPAAAPRSLVPLERVDSTGSGERTEFQELKQSNASLKESLSRMKAEMDDLERSRAAPPAPVADAAPAAAPAPVEPARPRITVEAVREILAGASIRDMPVGMNSDGHVVVTLPGSMSFGPGKAVLMKTGRSRLKALIAALMDSFPDVTARAEGHTDSDPIRKSGWASNQALSEARAKAVADYMAGQTGLSSDGVSYAGFGPTRPVASEKTREGKAQNRRVEIVLMQ